MQGGRLRNKAAIYTPEEVANDFGEVDSSFSLLGTYYCSVTSIPETEFKDGQTLISTVRYDLRFRYYSALENISRASYIMLDGKKLEIKAISNVKQQNKQLHFICEERT